MKERLNKALARSGVASRRGADRLIAEGRVSVNGRVVQDLGRQVESDTDSIKVDGKRIASAPRQHVYLLLNKPRGYVTTLRDPEGRPTVRELIPGSRRLFPVGRLDFHSEGLLLLTDDGALCRSLTHPSGGVPRTYEVKVRATPNADAVAQLERGVVLGGRRAAGRVKILRAGHNAWLELTVREGRNHIVRRMLLAVGHRVLKLRRTRYAGVHLEDLDPGEVRPLTVREVAGLKRFTRGAPEAGRKTRSRRN